LVQIEGVNRVGIARAVETAFLETISAGKLKTVRDHLMNYKQATGKMAVVDQVKNELSTEGNVGLGGEAAKVYDCKQHGENSELYLVEGLSAAGGLLNTRDLNIHAVLPLKGKIMNGEKAGLDKAMSNNEIKAMFKILGCGIEGINFKMDKLRYGKICIATDADPDGKNIAALLVGVFTAFAPELIKAGKVVVIDTPLYQQDGKYIFAEEDLNRKGKYERFKGLGALTNDDVRKVVFGKQRHMLTLTDHKSIAEAGRLIASPGPKKKLMQDVGLLSEGAYDFPFDD
jgi:DNA gyrase subunit B